MTVIDDSETSTPAGETGPSVASSMRDESVTTSVGSVKAAAKGSVQRGDAGKKSEGPSGKDAGGGGKDGGETKKPTTKAERRALQEAQRAAKAAAKGEPAELPSYTASYDSVQARISPGKKHSSKRRGLAHHRMQITKVHGPC